MVRNLVTLFLYISFSLPAVSLFSSFVSVLASPITYFSNQCCRSIWTKIVDQILLSLARLNTLNTLFSRSFSDIFFIWSALPGEPKQCYTRVLEVVASQIGESDWVYETHHLSSTNHSTSCELTKWQFVHVCMYIRLCNFRFKNILF